ncbi:DUF3748 domain-containing protein [Parafilimonas sp.]|uniref:DUF3748 domain-containing protein n=1 Tax=Parafilimonas sp. TaxID=1969739 RepID=UPI0039E229C5
MTNSAAGHTLHHNGVFSKDGQWIVFDGRNEETKIGETAAIGIINVKTREEKIIYRILHPTLYGPGVGAASFSPVADRVIFIHGLAGAGKEKPYGFTRRTGVAVDINRPFQPIYMDARDITYPYTPGSLRGGTHSHCWSPDGKMISFTYNDELVNPDLRSVGVLFNSGKPVITDTASGNNNGEMFAAIIAHIVKEPKPGSNEINKAFDECWVGTNGYVNNKGKRIPHALAFQGNTINKKGETVTEIFVTDIDTTAILNDPAAVGTPGEWPRVPAGLTQRRVTSTVRGLSPVRHWLRSSTDGRYIYALASDDKNISQIIRCNINSGEITYLTQMPFPVDHPFNLNKDGSKVAFIANNNVYVLDMNSSKIVQLTFNQASGYKITGAPLFSPDGKMLVFNQYQLVENKQYLQIMSININ